MKSNMATFHDDSAFVEYAELLKQLQVLIEAGRGESPEADAIRDRMDQHWNRLTKEEIAEIDRLSDEASNLLRVGVAPTVSQ